MTAMVSVPGSAMVAVMNAVRVVEVKVVPWVPRVTAAGDAPMEEFRDRTAEAAPESAHVVVAAVEGALAT